MYENVFERNAPGNLVIGQCFAIVPIQLKPRHDHARHPEENNVKPGYQHTGRIPEIHFLSLLCGRLGPAKIRHRPQVGRCPGIEHICFLFPVFRVGWSINRNMHMVVVGKVEFSLLNPLLIPDRDAMPPPQLSADTPVLNAIEPVQVSLFPAVRMKADRPILHRSLCFRHFGIFEKPLLGKTRFDWHIATFREANGVFIGFGFNQQSHLLQFSRSGFAGLETLHTGKLLSGQRVEPPVRINHFDHFQTMSLTDLKVVLVMCRRNFKAPGAKLTIDIAIADDRNSFLWEGAPDCLAD